MPTYVDGYLLPIPKKNIEKYKKMATIASKVWRDHGALDYREAEGEDLKIASMGSFSELLKTKPTETVIFAYVTFKSRAHRDKVNAAVMKDPRLTATMGDMKDMPFDCTKMMMGGFSTIVEAKGTGAAKGGGSSKKAAKKAGKK